MCFGSVALSMYEGKGFRGGRLFHFHGVLCHLCYQEIASRVCNEHKIVSAGNPTQPNPAQSSLPAGWYLLSSPLIEFVIDTKEKEKEIGVTDRKRSERRMRASPAF